MLYLYDTSKHATGAVRVLDFRHSNKSNYGEKAAIAYVRYLAAHPATAKRIARKLAVRFVSDDPRPPWSSSWPRFTDATTPRSPVLRALFWSRAFKASLGDKVRRPFADMVATVRALGIRPPAAGTDGVRQLYWLSGSLGHPPLGWHPPDGYPDVADSWRSAGGTLTRW